MTQTLRDYQVDAIREAYDHLYIRDFQGTIIHLATGLGKTITGIEFCRKLIDEGKVKRIMFAVNMRNLVHQGYADFAAQYPELLNRPFGLGKVMANFNEANADVTIVTPQTLSDVQGVNKRLDEVLSHGPIDLLIIDEAHYAVSASYMQLIRRLREANPQMKILGQTATPVRYDGLALSQVFDTICISRNLKWGVDQGYLCEPKVFRIETNIELPSGKGTVEERAKVLNVKNWTDIMIESYQKHGENRQGVYFLPSVAHSEALALAFNEMGIAAAHVDDKTKDKVRDRINKDFRKGKIRIICNFGILTTGWDMPQVALIGYARPTDNPVLATQILGRGTRNYPGKDYCKVLDYTLQGIELVTAGRLTGHFFTEDGEEVEDEIETEVIEDGVNLKDMDILDGKFDKGNGVLVTPWQLFRMSKDAWHHDPSDMTFFTMQASFQYPGSPKHVKDRVFAVTLPNYTLARRIWEGIKIGRERLKAAPNDQRVQQFLTTLEQTEKVFDSFTLWTVEKEGMQWKINPSPIHHAPNFDLLLDETIDYLHEHTEPLCSKKSKSWRYQEASQKQIEMCDRFHTYPENKGHASRIISHGLVKPVVKNHLAALQAACGKYGVIQNG